MARVDEATSEIDGRPIETDPCNSVEPRLQGASDYPPGRASGTSRAVCGWQNANMGGDSGGEPPRVVALVPDLMDRSRIELMAASAGVALTVVPNVAQFHAVEDHHWDVVLIDLGTPDALSLLPGPTRSLTVGFGSHVDRELLATARAAGCGEVVSRMVLFRRLSELLKEGAIGRRTRGQSRALD